MCTVCPGPQMVQKRGATVIEKRGLSSAMSAAKAIVDHMRSWWFGTKEASTPYPQLHTGREEVSCISHIHTILPSPLLSG